jgi:L-fuconolactonase
MTERTATPADADPPLIEHLHLNPTWLAQTQEPALEPQRPLIDPHHHLWDLQGGYLLDELLADLNSGHQVVATVFAQCGYAYRRSGPEALRPVGETEFVARVAAQARERGLPQRVCAGIVGHADLRLGDAVLPVLHAHIEAGQGHFRGVRHINARHEAFNASLLGRPPAGLFQHPGFRRGLQHLQEAGLSFDAWSYHTQLDELCELARAFPQLPIVLNHVGGPLAVGPFHAQGARVHREWRASMQRLAACPNVHVKLGGLAMMICGFDFHRCAVPASSQELATAWAPYLEGSIELFGAQRCMFESNFPVDKAMCSYAVLWNAFKRVAAGASAFEKAWLFHNTANQFYRLGLAPVS